MFPSIIVAAPQLKMPDLPPPKAGAAEISDLLRQSLDVQKDQVQATRNLFAQHDSSQKWKAFLTRWQDDFPDIGQECKRILPTVERAYLNILREVTERLADTDTDELENDFTLGEFLDRYGTRLGQLAGIISQLSPLADHALPPAPTE